MCVIIIYLRPVNDLLGCGFRLQQVQVCSTTLVYMIYFRFCYHNLFFHYTYLMVDMGSVPYDTNLRGYIDSDEDILMGIGAARNCAQVRDSYYNSRHKALCMLL